VIYPHLGVPLSRGVRALFPYGSPEGLTLAHWCPACGCPHVFNVESAREDGAVWAWDGNVNSPTVSPRLRFGCGETIDEGVRVREAVSCEYVLSAGVISYSPDSTHEMAGREVPLPDWPGCSERRERIRHERKESV
jgi:hypothetical protein